MATAPSKVCTVCGLDKAASEYYTDKRAPHGLCTQCKQCMNERKKAKRGIDPEATRAAWREDYQKNRERYQRASLAYYTRNRTSILANYRPKPIPESFDRGARNEYQRSRYAVNPWPRRLSNRHRSAVKRAAREAGLTAPVLRQWINAQPKRCYWCGCNCKSRYHLDHYTPLSRGGGHELANLVIACPACNLSKANKDPLDFAREVGRLM